jgi:hypothetical protein
MGWYQYETVQGEMCPFSTDLVALLNAGNIFVPSVIAEVELMKERFAKLLLGDDMSGGAKGVCTAMAISNAITNLSGICF